MKKVGLSVFDFQEKYGDAACFRAAREAGADCVDFDLSAYDVRNVDGIYARSECEIADYFLRLRSAAESENVEIALTHGRCEGPCGDKKSDLALRENARLDCFASSLLGAPVCVMHTVSSYRFPNAAAEEMSFYNREFFCGVLPYAAEFSVLLATETFGSVGGTDICEYYGCLENFTRGLREIRESSAFGDRLFVCMDVGHTHRCARFGEPSVVRQIERLGKDIAAVHLHDNHGLEDEHRIPGEGTIAWKEVLNALDSVGFSGVYNLEVSLGRYGDPLTESAGRAVRTMRRLLREIE